ncbi:Double-strand break repair protein mre11a [Actinomortierella ambigua]|nr:Double-strand break repair protein mre11a [Actinomortierella ambigua]
MSDEQEQKGAWSQGQEFVDEDTFKILVATDNHLGYLEKDPVRGNDSFAAFEEVLKLAADSEVDMILLGGDLFHDNKPSRKTLHTTSMLLRKYCMGDKPVFMEFLSNPKDNFPEGIDTVNYQDPNLNVAIPVFSIHGNHDDPSGEGNLCALDILAMNGLVNYFGRSHQVDKVEVWPILLRKGLSNLALYGIGNIRDERLHQTFLQRRVEMVRPVQDSDEEPWFNLLVLHQNRVMHGAKNYIPEAFLDDFLSLVIWGHEHECKIDPMYNPQQGFHVTQPGSSVATSLSDGESRPKHVAILKIWKDKFDLQKIRLNSVRPFVMDDVILSENNLPKKDQKRINQFIANKIKEMINTAEQEWRAACGNTTVKRRAPREDDDQHDDEEPGPQPEFPKPLIRLRVEYSGGYDIFNPQRFGQEFADRVANPKDIVHFFRKKTGGGPRASDRQDTIEFDAVQPDTFDNARVEVLVQQYLQTHNLNILAEAELANAVRMFVEKDERDAIKDFVSSSLKRMQQAMRSKENIEAETAFMEEVSKEKSVRAAEYARGHPTNTTAMSSSLPSTSTRGRTAFEPAGATTPSADESDSMDIDQPAKKPTHGKGGRTAPKGRVPTAAQSSKARTERPSRGGARKVYAADSLDEYENEDGHSDRQQESDQEDQRHKQHDEDNVLVVTESSHDEQKTSAKQTSGKGKSTKSKAVTTKQARSRAAPIVFGSEDEDDADKANESVEEHELASSALRSKGKAPVQSRSSAASSSSKTTRALGTTSQSKTTGTAVHATATPLQSTAGRGNSNSNNSSQSQPTRMIASISRRRTLAAAAAERQSQQSFGKS